MRPNPHETSHLKVTFDTFPRDYDPRSSPWYRFYRLLQHFEKVAPGAVTPKTSWLDIGCHSGSFLRAVTAIYGVADAHGCDVYPEEDKTERRYDCFQMTNNDHWEYHTCDVSRGISLPRTFEVVSASEVIEHVIDTDKFLEDIRGVLSDGGYLLLTTPNINNLRNRVRVPLGLYPIGLEYRNIIHHVRLYNTEALSGQLRSHKFRVLSVAGVQMVPESIVTKSSPVRLVSEGIASLLPQLAPNILLVAQKDH